MRHETGTTFLLFKGKNLILLPLDKEKTDVGKCQHLYSAANRDNFPDGRQSNKYFILKLHKYTITIGHWQVQILSNLVIIIYEW